MANNVLPENLRKEDGHGSAVGTPTHVLDSTVNTTLGTPRQEDGHGSDDTQPTRTSQSPHKAANISRPHSAYLTTDTPYVSNIFDWLSDDFKHYTDLQIATHAYAAGGAPFTLTVYFEGSNDPTFPAERTTTIYEYGHSETNTIRGFPINFAAFRYARVRAGVPSADLEDFEVNSFVSAALARTRGRQISGIYPEDTNLEFLVGSVQFGQLPQGGSAAVGITRNRNSKVSIEEIGVGLNSNLLNADSTASGSVLAEGIRDDIAYSWTEEDPNLVCLDQSSGGTAGPVPGEGQAYWKTGTTNGNTCVFTSLATVFYNAGHEIIGEWTQEWHQPPTAPESKPFIGLFTASNGFGHGYTGTEYGLLFRRAGVDTFIPRSSWNIDTLEGADESLFTKRGVPVIFDPEKNQRVRVKGALLGAETWSFEVRSPDRTWVKVHEVFRINEDKGSLFDDFNLKMRVELDNTGSTTDVEVRSGSWRAGSVTSEPSDFTKLLTRQLGNTDELRLDVEPTSSQFYLGKAPDGSSTADAVWQVMQIGLSATRNPNRIRFRRGVAWDNRTLGW